MSEVLSILHQANRSSHIVFGFVGLVLFWIPVFARKGGRLHRLAGKGFAAIALWVGLTGFLGSAWAVFEPVSYMTSLDTKVSEKAMPYVIENNRFFFSLLSFLSIATFSGVIYGVAVVWAKSRHHQLRNVWVIGSLVATVVVAAALAGFGAWNLYEGMMGTHLLSANATRKYWVCVILGGIGVVATIADLRYVLGPTPGGKAWFYKHMESMLGTGIAFYTAFLVFGAARFYEFAGIKLTGVLALLPWILPSAIGIPVITLWVKRYRRKFGEG